VHRRGVVTATINGKRHRWKGRLVFFTAGPSGVIAIAGMPPRGGIIRTLGFACPVVLAGATFPLSPDPATCNATYTEERVRRPVTINAWSELSGVQVTYANFVSGRSRGRSRPC
jgi:hypothetical protein